jgi:hypothetical protein
MVPRRGAIGDLILAAIAHRSGACHIGELPSGMFFQHRSGVGNSAKSGSKIRRFHGSGRAANSVMDAGYRHRFRHQGAARHALNKRSACRIRRR